MKQGDLVQDRYLLETQLGKGGMAEVWRALDQRLERPVAIKFLAPQFTADPEFLVRFFSEAQSIARISHPNVVSVLDFGDRDGSPYLVMQYMPGGTVTELTGEPILPERAFEIVRDAACGAGAAHEHGIVHRDIKPGNILLGDDGRATVADFGIASSAVFEKLTATGQVIGSPHYISPEQASGQGSRPESDVYALGIVLYELLTGAPPFDADNPTAIAISHVDDDPPAPSTMGADVGPEIDALVLRILDKDPEARFANGNELATALEERIPSIARFGTAAATAVAGAAAAEATVARAASVSFDDTYDGEPLEYNEEPLDKPRRGMVVAGMALIALLLVGAAVWAADRFGDEPRPAVASASESEDEPTSKRKPKRTASPTGEAVVEDDLGETEATPTPTPSETEEEEKKGVVVERVPGSNDNDPTREPSPTSSPSAYQSPSPTSEPSQEPTSAPSQEP